MTIAATLLDDGKEKPMEDVMRSMIVALGLAAFAVTALAMTGGPATAAKSKMGCEVGKEYWDATEGKCMKGKAKKKSAKKGGKSPE